MSDLARITETLASKQLAAYTPPADVTQEAVAAAWDALVAAEAARRHALEVRPVPSARPFPTPARSQRPPVPSSHPFPSPRRLSAHTVRYVCHPLAQLAKGLAVYDTGASRTNAWLDAVLAEHASRGTTPSHPRTSSRTPER